jgi:hypothetical protein
LQKVRKFFSTFPPRTIKALEERGGNAKVLDKIWKGLSVLTIF